MKSTIAVGLVGWSFWAGYTVIHVGHSFGVLLPIAGLLLLIGTFSGKRA